MSALDEDSVAEAFSIGLTHSSMPFRMDEEMEKLDQERHEKRWASSTRVRLERLAPLSPQAPLHRLAERSRDCKVDRGRYESRLAIPRENLQRGSRSQSLD